MATINFNKLEIKTLLLVEMSECPMKSCKGMVWQYSSVRATMQSWCTPASTASPPYISGDTARTAAVPGDTQGEVQRTRATAAGTQQQGLSAGALPEPLAPFTCTTSGRKQSY